MYMSMVHLEPPVLDPAVAIDGEGLDGELPPDLVGLVLRLALVVGQHPWLQHEVSGVDEGAADLAPTVTDHPPLVHHRGGRGRRHHPPPSDPSLPLLSSKNTASGDDRFDPPNAAKAAAAELLSSPGFSAPLSSWEQCGLLLVVCSVGLGEIEIEGRMDAVQQKRGHGRNAASASQRCCWAGLLRSVTTHKSPGLDIHHVCDSPYLDGLFFFFL